MQDKPYAPMDDQLYTYVIQEATREAPLLAELRRETAAALPGQAHLQISPDQGAFLAWLAELMGVGNYLEVGTFTGYSALAVMLAARSDACAVCLDRSAEWTAMARRYWARAGVDARIELMLAEAETGLEKLQREDRGGFDLAFIDADKEGYIGYYEAALQLLRPGGVVVADNVLWQGAVADPQDDDADTRAIRAFNRHVTADERVASSLVTVGDGLMLARKR